MGEYKQIATLGIMNPKDRLTKQSLGKVCLLTVEHHEELVKSQKFREALEHPGSTRFFGNMPTNVVSNATI